MRTSSPIGLLLDVDAPVASTETRTGPEGIIDVLVRLARRGVPVGFNKGLVKSHRDRLPPPRPWCIHRRQPHPSA